MINLCEICEKNKGCKCPGGPVCFKKREGKPVENWKEMKGILKDICLEIASDNSKSPWASGIIRRINNLK